MQKISSILAVLLFVCLFVPQVAFAAWWNPLSWNIFAWFTSVFTQEHQIATTTSTATIVPTPSENKSAKKEVVSTPTANAPAPKTSEEVQTVICQGTTRAACPAGQDFVCMPDGTTYCQPHTPTPQPSTQYYTLPNGAVVDSNGNIISAAPQAEQPASQPQTYVNPLYAQGKANLAADLDKLRPGSCSGNALFSCQQTAEDAVLQAKYAVLANISDQDANALLEVVQGRITGFQGLQKGYSTTGTSAVGGGNAMQITPIILNLQQVQSILSFRVW